MDRVSQNKVLRNPSLRVRVQKILAMAGIASRRKCEEYIKQGRVKVNGKIAKTEDAASLSDKITLDDKQITFPEKIVIMLNKPAGYVTTVSETHGMKTVFDIVKIPQRLFPVGRLDKNTEGLLLITNDGELANKLTHPRYEVQKEYYAVLDKEITKEKAERIKQTEIDGRKVKIISFSANGKTAKLAIHEGRKHIVRRLFEENGLKVVKLVRTRVAGLTLRSLPLGKWRKLEKEEIRKLTSQQQAF